MTMKQPGVKQAASAGMWSSIEMLFRQGVQFGVSVLLARLLQPADFGVIALLLFFTSLSTVFTQGLTLGLVQRKDTTQDEESAVFWMNMAEAIVVALVLVALGGVIARFYHQPVLKPLMAVAGAQIVLSALGAVQNALLSRELRFDRLMRAGVASSILSGIAGVLAALAGWGVWALALQTVTAAALSSMVLWMVSPWRPSFHFRFGTLRPLWSFGSWLSLSTALEVVYTQGFALLLGKFYGMRQLGFFNRALGTAQLPTSVLSMLVSRIALPLFSARNDDPAAVRRGARLAIGLSMMLNVPAMLGLAILSPLVTQLLFGTKWLPSAPILSILALGGMLLPLHVVNVQIVLAQGASVVFFRLEVAKKLAGVTCVLAGSLFGIYGLAWSGVVASIIAFWLNAMPNRRSIDYGMLRQVIDLSGLFLPSAAMCGVIWLLRGIIVAPLVVEVAVLVLAGAATYLAAGLALRVSLFRDALDIGFNLLRSGRAVAV